ncbi:MAG: hypothetical protein C4551_08130 [Bacillota bacterium]|nr:MAG: hypothetical protein C4551_08130 [Bacillota bacterium]
MPWVILAIVIWVVTLLAVPQENFRRLVPFGIIAGFGLALLINMLGSSIFGLWGFRNVVWPILGIPFWVLLSWVPAVILFVHYLPETSLARLGWLLLFPVVFTAIEFLFLRQGLRFFSPDWNLVYSFLLSLGVHILVLSYYLTSVRSPVTSLSPGWPRRENRHESPGDRETRESPGDRKR